jgi:hypothetical protein
MLPSLIVAAQFDIAKIGGRTPQQVWSATEVPEQVPILANQEQPEIEILQLHHEKEPDLPVLKIKITRTQAA